MHLLIVYLNHNLQFCKNFPGLFDAIDDGKEASIKFYNDWVADVKESVSKEKLLIFNVKEGWKPLCDFLDVPIPDQPFPHANDSKVMKDWVAKLKFASWTFIIAVPVLISFFLYCALY